MSAKLISTLIGTEVSSIYFAEDWVDSWYDHTNKVIVTTWFNLSTSVHYRKSYEAKLAAAKKYNPLALIIDTSKAFGMPYPEDHRWLKGTIFPEAKKLNLKFIINIFPENSIAKTGVKTILNFGKQFDFDILEMTTLEEAFEFIKSR